MTYPPPRIEAAPKGRQWYQTHEIVASLLSPFVPGITPPTAAGRFAHANGPKCCQNERGKALAEARLFNNCRPYLGRELEIIRPDATV